MISLLIPASIRCRSASWLSIDCFWLARWATICACAGAGVFQVRPPLLDLLAERLHVSEHLSVLVADALHHVEAVEQVVEVLRAEKDLDRAATVAVDVERPQAFLDMGLSDARLCRATPRWRAFELRSPSIRSSWTFGVVVRLDRLLELRRPTRWICASTACAWARFDSIEGFAVAEPRPVEARSRGAPVRQERAGACRVLELFINLVRSSKGTPLRRYPSTKAES